MKNQNSFSADVRVQSDSITAEMTDRRPDVLQLFGHLDDSQRNGFVTDAWMIGMRAIMNAHKSAEEARLKDVGKTMVSDLERELGAHVTRHQELFVQMLGSYFDPKNGQVAVRIDNFVKDGGELARTMEQYLAPESGSLSRSLAKALGENSPLLRRLSATDKEGIVHMIESKVSDALAKNQAAVTRALDPLCADGAVARFLQSLKKDMEKSDSDRTKQLLLVTKALDANDPGSLLSRLMKETSEAKVTFVQSMNPDAEGSPLAVLKTSLTNLLEKSAKNQAEMMTAFSERQQQLEQSIQAAVVRLDERRSIESRSPRGGLAFEASVQAFVRMAVAGAPVLVEDTGGTVGHRSNCKIGDQVVSFTTESVFSGATLVVEAKHDASYSVKAALGELELARGNRGAQVGVFVMAQDHACPGFPKMARYGTDILVSWDAQDESTDPYLHAAILLGLALASRSQRATEAGDIEALNDIEHRITRELERHEKMKKLTDSIHKDADALGEELRKGDKFLKLLLKDAKETLKSLKVELVDHEKERGEPISLGGDSLTQARRQLANPTQDGGGTKVLKSA